MCCSMLHAHNYWHKLQASVGVETRGAEIKTRHKNESPIDFVHSSGPRSRLVLNPTLMEATNIFFISFLKASAHCILKAVVWADTTHYTSRTLSPLTGASLLHFLPSKFRSTTSSEDSTWQILATHWTHKLIVRLVNLRAWWLHTCHNTSHRVVRPPSHLECRGLTRHHFKI